MRTVALGVTVLLMAAGVTLAALLTVGGAALVTTSGTSMEPRFHSSDLVLVTPAASYRVGDVVAYRSTELDTVVLHRIVSIEHGRYELQGDNNTWIDSEKPSRSQLIGTAWLHIPGGGRWLRLATAPPALAAMAFLLVISGGTATHMQRRRRKDASVSPQSPSAPRPRTFLGLPPSLRPVVAAAITLALAGAALAGLSWSRPADVTDHIVQPAVSTLEFSYTASVWPSAAYDGTTVKAPQPVFRQLTEMVDVGFRYEGEPGTVAVDAELSTSAGWRSTVRLAETVEFSEPVYEGSVPVDLASLQARADAAAEVIGIPADDVKIAIIPRFTGREGDRFAPRLELVLDPLAMRLSSDAVLTAESGTAIASTEGTPAALSVLGREVDVSVARILSLAALGVAALLGAGVAYAGWADRRAPEAERVRKRYGQLVLPVLPIAFPPGRPVIEVPDVESLARLAERYGLLVLHWSRDGADTYVVQDEATTYRYRTDKPSTLPSPPARLALRSA